MNQKNAKEAATVRPGSGWARIDQALADCPNVYIVAVIFLTALTVRTILLGRAELWEDEILYAHRVSPPDYTPWKLLSHRFTHFAQLPYLPLPDVIQNIFLWGWHFFQKDVVHNPLAQRIVPVLFGSGTASMLYLLARRLINMRVALAASAMFCFFYFPVFYSREARFYAPLLFFCVTGMYTFVILFEAPRIKPLPAVLFLLSLIATAYSMLTGFFLAGTLFGTLILLMALPFSVFGAAFAHLAKQAAEQDRKAVIRRLGILAGICLAALLSVAYWVFLVMTGDGLMMSMAKIPSIPTILSDLLGRLFMGARSWRLLLAWVFMLFGIAACLVKGPRRAHRIMFLWITAVTFGLLMYGVISKSYYFARTFYLVVGFLYILFALGIDLCARLITARTKQPERWSGVVLAVITICLVLYHLFVPLPHLWQLKAKSNNFGAIAAWLNANLEKGTPYMLESAYQQRYIPYHYPTPDLTPITPFTHGAGQLEKLRNIHKRNIFQFPDLYFIASALHKPDWTWLDQYFQSKVEIINKPLKWLFESGFEGIGKVEDNMSPFYTPIYFNTPEQYEQICTFRGQLTVFSFKGWRITHIGIHPRDYEQQYKEILYGRVAPSPTQAVIHGKKIPDTTVKGTFTLYLLVAADAKKLPVRFWLDKREVTTPEVLCNGITACTLEDQEITNRHFTVTCGVNPEHAGIVKGLVVYNIDFQRTP